jgi:hypothetical protein
MLNIGRFMLFTLKMYLSNTIMSNKLNYYKEIYFYLGELLEKNNYIEIKFDNSTTKN